MNNVMCETFVLSNVLFQHREYTCRRDNMNVNVCTIDIKYKYSEDVIDSLVIQTPVMKCISIKEFGQNEDGKKCYSAGFLLRQNVDEHVMFKDICDKLSGAIIEYAQCTMKSNQKNIQPSSLMIVPDFTDASDSILYCKFNTDKACNISTFVTIENSNSKDIFSAKIPFECVVGLMFGQVTITHRIAIQKKINDIIVLTGEPVILEKSTCLTQKLDENIVIKNIRW